MAAGKAHAVTAAAAAPVEGGNHSAPRPFLPAQSNKTPSYVSGSQQCFNAGNLEMHDSNEKPLRPLTNIKKKIPKNKASRLKGFVGPQRSLIWNPFG